MDDEWDLHAVVRGCAATGTTTTTITGTASNNVFPSSSPLPLHNDHENLFDFPGFIDERINPFQGLQEIYREFCVDQSPSATAAEVDITDTSTISIVVGQDFQSQQLTQPPQEILQMPSLHQMNLPRSSQENLQFKNPVFGSSSLTFPAGNSQPVRPRRRKNQQLKMVHEMTQEELSADSWAWRKYGQKPIKGSPYPRNYYRCSTSKGCAARKQVERSPNDPSIFVVSYTGEHTHPRPTHRSSLAGSTRNKLSPATAGIKQNTVAPLFEKGSFSSSSPASGSCFSPSTPLTEGETAVDMEVTGEVEGGAGGDGDDDNNPMIIPSDHLMNDDDEDIFKGFQDSDHSSGGGDLFSSGLVPSPPWTPTSSTVTTATFNSG